MKHDHQSTSMFNGSAVGQGLAWRGGGTTMTPNVQTLRSASVVLTGLSLVLVLLAWGTSVHARVTRIVIDSPANYPLSHSMLTGQDMPYETIAGRAFGELDPNDPRNAIIQDIELAPKNAKGKVEYMATFFIVKPIDMSRASGIMWHDVPNRGGRLTLAPASRNDGDVGLSSGWQGDNSGTTAQNFPNSNDYVVVPIAKHPDGSPIRGRVMGRILNASGVNSQPMIVHSNPVPYKPVSLDTRQAKLVSRVHETIEGVVSGESEVASADWAWARCSATNPFPGTPDPAQICVRGGFIANRVYQVVFTTQDPPVLGIGFAAFRDVGTFFKNEVRDDAGTANPLAGGIHWLIGRGVSQSGNYLRAFLHLGFNEDEAGRQVQDGTWPIIAGRRVALNFRFAMPDGVLKLYEPGSEGPQWWARYPDHVRGLPTRGILDRCRESDTCPKIIEHFGAAEVWGLKPGPEWVGTDAKKDIPLPRNVRRYYIPSTQHGGGSGGFSVTPAAAPSCPSTGYGQGTFAANPVPHTETVNAIRFHFRNWVMNGTKPPASLYPTLRANALRGDEDDGDEEDDDDGHDGRKPDGFLVEPTKKAMGFPNIPALMDSSKPTFAPDAPEAGRFNGKAEFPFINPVLDYDWGPEFNPSDGSGVPTKLPPPIRRVIKMLVPRVDADGNELGGVPVVLRDAPLGTYLGWNITVSGFHKGQNCNYTGGVIPFARTKAERDASKDPRPSLQERYTDHAGYVAAVRAAAANAVKKSFLLQADADALIVQADASNVLK